MARPLDGITVVSLEHAIAAILRSLGRGDADIAALRAAGAI